MKGNGEVETSSPGGDFSAQVAAAAQRLTPQERLVAEYLLDRPQDAVTASTAELAAATGTSDATVVRAARSLGYSGLRELKRALLTTLADPRDPAAVLEHRLARAGTGVGPVLNQLIADATTLLTQLPEELDEASWRRAVDLLETAETRWLYGIGPAGQIAEYHALTLSRIRRRAHAITEAGFRLADPLMGIGAKDVLVIYAPLRRFHEIDIAVKHANRINVPVILITETLGAAMADRVTVVLNLPPAAPTTISENLLVLFLADALTFELAKRDPINAVAARQALTQLRNEIATGTTIDSET